MSGLGPPLPKAQGAAGTVGLRLLPVGCGAVVATAGRRVAFYSLRGGPCPRVGR